MTTTASNQPQWPSSNPASNQKPLSLDDVSKFFSLPLVDAADSLGVCTSVLKKICHDNGLVRWPYRKFRSGKSIEEIKKDDGRELAELSGEKTDTVVVAASSASMSLGSQIQNKTAVAGRAVAQQQAGNKKGTPAITDEFKYGFPSVGLSASTYRWWGNQEIGQQSSDLDNGNDNFNSSGGGKSKNVNNESNVGPEGAALLLSVRRRAAEEGREALKLGVYRGGKKLGRKERVLLRSIFKSSLLIQ